MSTEAVERHSFLPFTSFTLTYLLQSVDEFFFTGAAIGHAVRAEIFGIETLATVHSADMLHQNRRTVGRSINMFDFVLKGANASQLEKDIGSDLFPANEHFFGLVNVSVDFDFVSIYTIILYRVSHFLLGVL